MPAHHTCLLISLIITIYVLNYSFVIDLEQHEIYNNKDEEVVHLSHRTDRLIMLAEGRAH